MNNQKKYLIKLLPSGKSVKVSPDYNLKQAILDSGIHIDSSKEKENGYVLSCLSKVESDLIIEVPRQKKAGVKIEKGRFADIESKIYADISKDELSAVEIKPWIKKGTIVVEKPSLSYGTSDLFRLKKSLSENLGIKILSFILNKCSLSLEEECMLKTLGNTS